MVPAAVDELLAVAHGAVVAVVDRAAVGQPGEAGGHGAIDVVIPLAIYLVFTVANRNNSVR